MKIFENKPENLLIDYKKFEIEYKDKGCPFLGEINISKEYSNYNDLESLIEVFTPISCSIKEGKVELSLLGLVHIYIIQALNCVGITAEEEIKRYYDGFRSSKNFQELPYLLDFYITHCLSGKEVNFYFLGNTGEVLFHEEFMEIKGKYGLRGDYHVISLNSILYKLGLIDTPLGQSSLYNLSDSEIHILKEIRSTVTEKLAINIKFKPTNNTPYEVTTKSKISAEDLSTLTKKARELGYGSFNIEVHNGGLVSGKSTKKIRLDKQN